MTIYTIYFIDPCDGPGGRGPQKGPSFATREAALDYREKRGWQGDDVREEELFASAGEAIAHEQGLRAALAKALEG